MTKVFEAKVAKHREELTKKLTSDSIDIEALQRAVAVYCSLLPDYFEELRENMQSQEVATYLQKEELFAQHAASSLERLKTERQQALLALAKGKKATNKY